MLDTQVQVPIDSDIALLEQWRWEFQDGLLELPNGYAADGVGTAVALSRNGKLLGSLTATIIQAVSLDPLIRNPQAGRHEMLAGLFALTRTLEYQAQLNGARDAYIAVPNVMSEYKELVKKCGFEETAQDCTLFRHSLRR